LIIANSGRTKDDLTRRLSVPEDRIEVVYYGTDSRALCPVTSEEQKIARDELGWPADRPVLAFVGALGDRRKGFDTLLTAWANACAKPDWRADLVVLGAGAELGQWRVRVARAGLDGRVRFLGFRCDVPRVLAACDALVAPTRYEAFGLGVQEALCSGLPAIVSSSAGVAERYTNGISDLLLNDPNDAIELADRLFRWQSRAEYYRSAAIRIAESLRPWTWDAMAERLVERIEGRR
jgi:glycosyltransferase involved in cell wall biosynthesis